MLRTTGLRRNRKFKSARECGQVCPRAREVRPDIAPPGTNRGIDCTGDTGPSFSSVGGPPLNTWLIAKSNVTGAAAPFPKRV